jgi:hypothetical protein
MADSRLFVEGTYITTLIAVNIDHPFVPPFLRFQIPERSGAKFTLANNVQTLHFNLTN